MDACDAVKKCCGLTQADPFNAGPESTPRRLPFRDAPLLPPGHCAESLPLQFPEESVRTPA